MVHQGAGAARVPPGPRALGPGGRRCRGPRGPRLASAVAPRDPALSAETEIALVTDRRSRWIADQYRATRTAVVELPPLEGVAAEEAAVEEAPAARGRGGRPPVEFEAAQISFTTAEQAFSLVTRYGGQLGALAPPPVVQAGEQWVNTAMAPIWMRSMIRNRN